MFYNNEPYDFSKPFGFSVGQYPLYSEKDEIFADNYWRVGVKTLLFALLVNHIDEEYFFFNLEDFNQIRASLCNRGCPFIYYAFTQDELLNDLRYMSTNSPMGYDLTYITSLDEDKYRANMNMFLHDIDVEFKEAKNKFFSNNIHDLKIFALFCRLKINTDILYDNYAIHALKLKLFEGN